jgi:hypothetical protein
MHLETGLSWRIDVRDPFDLFFALYVRDSLGLVGDEPLPRLSAPVPRWEVARSARLDALAVEWRAWWTSLLAERSGASSSRSLEGPIGGLGIQLRDVQEALMAPARRWRAAHEWQGLAGASMVPIDVVREIESSTGRQVRPFTYSLDVVPVAAPYVLDASEHRALISEAECTDSAVLAGVLRSRVAPLA